MILQNTKDLVNLFKSTFDYELKDISGKNDLWVFLESTTFFSEPAAGSYHNNFPGGLVLHTLNFNKVLKSLVANYYNTGVCLPERISTDRFNCFLVALGHDLDKIGRYKVEESNGFKKYGYKKKFNDPPDHNPLVVINKYIPDVSRSEFFAIKYAEGGWTAAKSKDNEREWKTELGRDARVYFTHVADMFCAFLKEPTLNNIELHKTLTEFYGGSK